MPSPFIHLSIAARTAERAEINGAELPLFMFGSAAADVDKITGRPRSATHFWDTRSDVSGALKLLASFPQVAAAPLQPVERAFVAGYLCHLVTDEQWTFAIYRPYFGRYSPYGGKQEGVERQWALATVLETRQLQEQSMFGELLSALSRSRGARLPSDLLPFVPMAQLEAMRDAVIAQAALAPGAERFRFLAELGRAAAGERERRAGDALDRQSTHRRPTDEAARLERFLAQLPELQAQAEAYVSRASVAEFERRALDESIALVRDYLRGKPPAPPRGTADPGDCPEVSNDW